MKPPIKPIAQVLIECAAWPEFAATITQDRDWLWSTMDLRGAHNEPVRQAIGKQGIGFRFAPQGHTLPDGRVAHWGHSCERPVRFTRKGKPSPDSSAPSDRTDSPQYTDEQLLSALS